MTDHRLLEAKLESLFAYMTGDHKGRWGMDIEQWDWVPGVGIVSIMAYGKRTGSEPVIRYVREWAERNKEKAGGAKVINAMAPFAVFPELYRLTREERYLKQSEEIVRWMMNEAPRTREGALEHTVTESVQFREQAWADTVYMAVLLIARHAGLTGDRAAAAEALRQTMLHLRLLQEPETGVLFHGWNCEAGDHMSAVRWTRANAWIALAVPEIVEEIGGLVDIPEELHGRYAALAKGLLSYRAAGGLWHTVLDRPDFYKESSGSAGIACGFVKAARIGLVDPSYAASALLTVEGLLPLIRANGEVAGVSGGTPVMESAEAYNRIKTYPTLYGQGLTMQLLTEALAIE
ncbi:glycoside hydrolase family 88/105 protein [Paenibacillus arenilitoris]|uniref:Glycoside hydrolase family 88 protein n=1 Tax=Paenibacillus arenilitoris TaxID=2772299 RepID=A0A927H921_9BACL|nr:glycoside hydrolase family 88 protein [Paenibacillus arenilitoris]MBD2872177.1 glycoside hydrolase family 88 protein [Paenibacillus arenilitoris]